MCAWYKISVGVIIVISRAGSGPLFVGYRASGHKLRVTQVPSDNTLLTVTVSWTTENGKGQRILSMT